MKCDKQNMLLYAVTDRAWVGKQTLYEQVESALKGGVTCVQLREKELDDEAFLKEAVEIHALCQRYGVPFFVNDNVDIAIRCHAEGVHVGQEDMAAAQVRARVGEGMMIGVSVHSVEEAREAVKHGADCLGVGAAFATHTKTDVDVLPHETLKAICDAVDIPVVAIGGIHKENILQLKGTGVDGVALVSAIFAADDIEYDAVKICYTRFDSMMTQTAATMEVLPLSIEPTEQQKADARRSQILYKPSSEEVFRAIIPEYVAGIVYGAVCESVASELAARRTAMDAATKNAGEMIDHLNLYYNRARQAAITQEITEIVAGAEI